MVDWTNEEERSAAIQEMIEKEVAGLKAKNQELLGKQQDLKSKYESVKDVDVEKYRELTQKEQQAEEELLMKKNEFEKLRERDREEYEAKINALQSKNEKLNSSLNNYVIEKQLSEAISKHDGNPLFLAPHMQNRVELAETDGGFEIVVKDASGGNMFNQEGGKATVEDLVKEFKNNEMFMGAFKGNGASGTGTQTSPKTSTSGMENPFRTKDIDAQTKLYKENRELYNQMKAEA